MTIFDETFDPTFSVTLETSDLWSKLWTPLADEAETEFNDPKCFALITTYLHQSGLFHLFKDYYGHIKPRKFSGNGKSAYYVYLSAFQKAIRYGFETDALYYFRCLSANGFGMQAKARLRTIFAEDIGLGDPILTLYLLVATSAGSAMQDELAEYLIVTACNTTKSRAQTDMINPLYFVGEYAETANAIKPRLAQDFDGFVADLLAKKYTIKEFLSAGLLLRGSKSNEQFGDAVTPLSGMKQKQNILIEALGLPSVLKRLALTQLNSNVPFSYGFIASWSLLKSDSLTLIENPWPKPDFKKLDDVFYSAFDQHTQPGKRSFAYVRKSYSKYFEGMTDLKESAYDVFGHAVFRVEGAYLHRLVSNSELDRMYTDCMHECWRIEGMSNETAKAVYQRLADDLEPLHKARRRIWT